MQMFYKSLGILREQLYYRSDSCRIGWRGPDLFVRWRWVRPGAARQENGGHHQDDAGGWLVGAAGDRLNLVMVWFALLQMVQLLEHGENDNQLAKLSLVWFCALYASGCFGLVHLSDGERVHLSAPGTPCFPFPQAHNIVQVRCHPITSERKGKPSRRLRDTGDAPGFQLHSERSPVAMALLATGQSCCRCQDAQRI